MTRILVVLTALAALVVALTGCGSDDTERKAAEYSASASAAESWASDILTGTNRDEKYKEMGYKPYSLTPGESDVYWKWLRDGDEDAGCGYSYSVSCWSIKLIAPNGCNFVYAKLNILNDSGSVIDWANDTASDLRPDDTAVLHFTSFDDGAAKARVTELTCR